MKNISILDKTFNITSNTHFYLGEIKNFDPSNLALVYNDNVGYEIRLSVSVDNQNYSSPIKIDDFDLSVINSNNISDYYVRLSFIKVDERVINKGFVFEANIDNTQYRIKLESIIYNNEQIEEVTEIITDNEKTITDGIWNFYDNQQININSFLEQCRSINDIYGHVCVYFKTSTTEEGTSNILSNNFIRDISSVKKFRLTFPNNLLPTDKIVYSEWDMMLDGDFVCHVVDSVFKQVFGEYEIPTSKDFIYLPISNKLFRVSSVQPKNGLMNVIGWWEVYLSKFEDDETINFTDEIKKALEGTSFEDIETNDFVNDFNDYVQDTNFDEEFINELQTEEKKDATENYTNKLVDKEDYIDVKETEIQRSQISKRLDIVSLKPSEDSFYPITMYDCSKVDKRTIAMLYDLKDATSLNKFSLNVTESIEFDFNYVFIGRFQGEIFDVEDEHGNIIFTVENNYTKINFINHLNQENKEFGFKLEKLEFYNISLVYNITNNQLSIKIYKLKNKVKRITFEDIFLFTPIDNNLLKDKLVNMYLYGGNYYINEIKLKINKNKIIHDYVNPILKS